MSWFIECVSFLSVQASSPVCLLGVGISVSSYIYSTAFHVVFVLEDLRALCYYSNFKVIVATNWVCVLPFSASIQSGVPARSWYRCQLLSALQVLAQDFPTWPSPPPTHASSATQESTTHPDILGGRWIYPITKESQGITQCKKLYYFPSSFASQVLLVCMFLLVFFLSFFLHKEISHSLLPEDNEHVFSVL